MIFTPDSTFAPGLNMHGALLNRHLLQRKFGLKSTPNFD
jgi:hypothetical protein